MNRFAFVIHPLHVDTIRRHFPWSRALPVSLVERLAAGLPARRLGTVTGVRSEATGERVEGDLIGLGATPREMLTRPAEFTYRRLVSAARIAHRRGAGVMGLGAFTSVVGDAGRTVASRSPIPVTSGNSLTVAATVETALAAAARMGLERPDRLRSMVVGATGSIGAACSRMLAETTRGVVLVSIEPAKLEALAQRVRSESPGAQVETATSTSGRLGECDVVVCATSAIGSRVLDISECKPGAVICDVARPPDVSAAEAALRSDVLVVESGEVRLPGDDVRFGVDIGLPAPVSYACLAETALLALAGRLESFTLGRDLDVGRIREIRALCHEHGFRLAELRSHGRPLAPAEIAAKRELAQWLRDDDRHLERARRAAAGGLARLPRASKGILARA